MHETTALARFLQTMAKAQAELADALLKTPPAPEEGPVEGLISAREASRLLGVSPSYLYEHRNEYPFTRHVGRTVRFERRGLLAWMNRAVGA